MRLLLASQNPGKIKEIQAIFKAIKPLAGKRFTFLEDLELATTNDLKIKIDVAETGQSYAENAALKALTFYNASKLITLADDSGLEVSILDGAPGLHSARYAPQLGASDADRRYYLLEQLDGLPRPWTARFHCTVAVADQVGVLHYAEGNCPGEIIPEERGTYGFGYDPIFLLPELGRTMAEMSMAEKNQLSHRARALQAALPMLQEIYERKKKA